MEGQTQKRGADSTGEKCRITFGARQAVTCFFRGDEETGGEPVGSRILIVEGAYARLDNIADDGTFIKDEVFWVGDDKIHHQAGPSAKDLMKIYVELGIEEPELFKDLAVFQQPAAYMDEITTTWANEDLGRTWPQAVRQGGLLASALGDTCKEAMLLTQTIPTWLASKMTPVP